MAGVDETLGSPEIDDEGFTHAEEVLADGDLVGPESADPVISKPNPDLFTSKELKEETEEGKKEGGKGAHNLKFTLLISGAVVAVLGSIFAIAKKIKEA